MSAPPTCSHLTLPPPPPAPLQSYVVVSVPLVSSNGSVELCDIQVGLTMQPMAAGSDSSTSGGGSTLSGGAIAGIVVGSVAGVAILAAAGVHVARRRSLAAAAAGKAAAAKGPDNGLDGVAVQAPPGDGMPSTGLSWGSGSAGEAGAAGTAAAGAAAAGIVAAGSGAVPLSFVDATSRSGGSSSGPLHGSPASASLATPGGLAEGLVSARASGGSSGTLLEATDLSKLPPGFNDVASSDFTLVRQIGDGSFGK